MRRTVLLTVALILLAASPAAAKEQVEKARACGADDCHTVAAWNGDQLPFELLGPAIEAGRRTDASPGAASQPRYRIALHTRPGRDVVRLDYLPGPNYIRVRGGPGAEAGGALLNRGYRRVTSPGARAT